MQIFDHISHLIHLFDFQLDGYVARKMGINSAVGSYLDPLADKVSFKFFRNGNRSLIALKYHVNVSYLF